MARYQTSGAIEKLVLYISDAMKIDEVLHTLYKNKHKRKKRNNKYHK